MTQKLRNWVFTAWIEKIKIEDGPWDYIIYGKEVCPTTNKEHLQGYVEFKNGTSMASLKKKLGDDKAHCESRKGTQTQAIDYCKKEGNWVEWGKKKNQGKRVDLEELRDEVLEGRDVDDIVVENPMAFHQYGRTLERIETIRMRSEWRTHMTEGIWYWGVTGVGKSHKAYDGFTHKTHYDFPNDIGWWDGYKQQPTVIINEFRGGMQYGELLSLVDKWPKSVRRRCKEPIPFTSKLVIITSALPPDEIYKNLAEHDSLEQLYRRFKIIKIEQGDTEVVRG